MPQDTVAIMWSNVSRVDSYKEKKWVTPGHIYTQRHYSQPVKDLFDTRGFYIRDLALIWSVDQILKNIGCTYYMFSMVDIKNHMQYEPCDAHHQISDLLPFYNETLDRIRPSVHQVVFNYDWYSRPFNMETQMAIVKQKYQECAGKDWPDFDTVFGDTNKSNISKKTLKEIFNLNKWDWKNMIHNHRRIDPHPTPLEHLEYLTKVLPEHSISFETYSILKHIDDELRNNHEKIFLDRSVMKSVMKSCNPNRW